MQFGGIKMVLQFFSGPIVLIALVVAVFLLWKVFKFSFKKIFSILGILVGIAILAGVFLDIPQKLVIILAAIGIIFAALAGFF